MLELFLASDVPAQNKATLGDYPDEYMQELRVITNDAVGHSMRVTYYTLAGILGAGFISSFFLSRKKIIPTADEAAGPPT